MILRDRRSASTVRAGAGGQAASLVGPSFAIGHQTAPLPFTTLATADATPRSATSHPTRTKRSSPLHSPKRHNPIDTQSKIEGQSP